MHPNYRTQEQRDAHMRRNREYLNRNPWMKHWRSIRSRCTYGRDKNYANRRVEITKEELKELWFRDKGWLLKRPTIDRTDNNGHYTKDNCRFVELRVNLLNRDRSQTPETAEKIRIGKTLWWSKQPRRHCSLCDNKHKANGLCDNHYHKQRRGTLCPS